MISFKQLGNFGRLGNQLFQISATISLALRNNDQYVFPSWNQEDNFNLHGCFSNNINPSNIYHEPSFKYQEIPYTPNTDLNGYFQSLKYFQEHEGLIKSILTPKKGFGIKWGTTSIHVRKGDYLALNDCYEQLTMLYYERAMGLINSKQYIVFSDDINWCKNVFKGSQFTFSENNDPATDLSIMLSCEHNIIANSSFSWWGAFLNKNPSKIVVAPEKWFGSKLPHDTRDLIPPEWRQI